MYWLSILGELTNLPTSCQVFELATIQYFDWNFSRFSVLITQDLQQVQHGVVGFSHTFFFFLVCPILLIFFPLFLRRKAMSCYFPSKVSISLKHKSISLKHKLLLKHGFVSITGRKERTVFLTEKNQVIP